MRKLLKDERKFREAITESYEFGAKIDKAKKIDQRSTSKGNKEIQARIWNKEKEMQKDNKSSSVQITEKFVVMKVYAKSKKDGKAAP